jgi:ATP-dependent RNA helicase DDX55/SPB4
VAACGASALAQKEQAKARRAEKKQANAAWSTQAARKEAKEVRKQKKDRKRKWLSKSHDPGPAVLTQGERERAAESDVEDDWDDLAHEEREAKKVRRGVVSQETFDEQFMDM